MDGHLNFFLGGGGLFRRPCVSFCSSFAVAAAVGRSAGLRRPAGLASVMCNRRLPRAAGWKCRRQRRPMRAAAARAGRLGRAKFAARGLGAAQRTQNQSPNHADDDDDGKTISSNARV